MTDKERKVNDANFVMPIAEVIMFDNDDIITTSGSMSGDYQDSDEDYIGE